MLDGLDNASIEMEEAKVCFAPIPELHMSTWLFAYHIIVIIISVGKDGLLCIYWFHLVFKDN